MADDSDWSTSANEVLQVRLTNPADPTTYDATFNPAFTYPIFGEEETIFGYQGLRVRLDFTADTLQPNLEVTSTSRFEPQGDTKPDDVEGPLHEVIPGLHPTPDHSSSITDDDESWTPPGTLLHKYTVKGQQYGIWSTTLSDPKAKTIMRNAQVFVLFFIEGGTMIELEDPDWTIDRWRVFFTYAIRTPIAQSPLTTYSFVGYCTAYNLWHLPETSDLLTPPSSDDPLPDDDPSLQRTVPSRSRISQFLILPPYQRGGHGSSLYETVYTYYLQQPQTIEIPVEDPNESFDDMRDICDLIHLRSNPAFTSLKLNSTASILPRVKTDKFPSSAILDTKHTQPIRRASKIIKRQFDRLVEMQLLSRIPSKNRNPARLTRKDRASDENDRAYYLWRLLVKQRLYKHNRDTLIQITMGERHEKLEEALGAVEKDYVRLLDVVERRMARREVERMDAGEEVVPTVNWTEERLVKKLNGAGRGLKRRIVEDEDDDDDDGDEAMEEVPKINGTASKRPRVEDT